MKRNKNANQAPIYKISLEHDANDSNLKKISAINNFVIRFELMKNSKVVQCRRCQRFAHTATNCSFSYRCVQCTEKHLPNQCPRKSNPKLPLGCVNCLSAKLPHDGHTANDYYHCEYYKKISNRTQTKDDNNKSNNKTFTNNILHPNNITEGINANNPWLNKNSNKGTSINSSLSATKNPKSKNKKKKNNNTNNVNTAPNTNTVSAAQSSNSGSNQHENKNSVPSLINALLKVLQNFTNAN